MKIITNTASALTQEEGRRLGITVIPVSVSLGEESLRDYADISSDEFVRLLQEGRMPSSSQPSVGDVLEQLQNPGEEILMLTVADGLSGEYSTAMGIRNSLPDKDKVCVLNSRSLAGPLRYMALKAARLRDKAVPFREVISQINSCAHSTISYVIPTDFQYLQRSGRITRMTSKIGGVLHLLPVLTQSEDRKRISFMTVRRTWKAAVGAIIASLKEAGVNEDHLISIAYADKTEPAQKVLQQIRESFPRVESELLQLPPSLIAHGGPGCIVVQSVLK